MKLGSNLEALGILQGRRGHVEGVSYTLGAQQFLGCTLHIFVL